MKKMVEAWKTVAAAVDPILEALTEEDMHVHQIIGGKPQAQNVGTWLIRLTTHMWYHNGEACAVRQLIDDRDLPQMVGSIPDWATYASTAE